MLAPMVALDRGDEAKHCCRELGFIPVEVNASDTRNKADKSAKAGMGGKLSNAIKELANNTALGVAQDGRRKRVRTDKFHAPICLARLCMRFLKAAFDARPTQL